MSPDDGDGAVAPQSRAQRSPKQWRNGRVDHGASWQSEGSQRRLMCEDSGTAPAHRDQGRSGLMELRRRARTSTPRSERIRSSLVTGSASGSSTGVPAQKRTRERGREAGPGRIGCQHDAALGSGLPYSPHQVG